MMAGRPAGVCELSDLNGVDNGLLLSDFWRAIGQWSFLRTLEHLLASRAVGKAGLPAFHI
jgi:hypothetical protein